MSVEKWVTVKDENIRHIWAPDESPVGQDEISVYPYWYAENGIPVNPETGNDMIYVRTEMKVSS